NELTGKMPAQENKEEEGSASGSEEDTLDVQPEKDDKEKKYKGFMPWVRHPPICLVRDFGATDFFHDQEKILRNSQATKSEREKKQAEAKMQEINEAYGVLSNPEKRQNYDRYGSAEGFQGPPEGGFDRSGDFFKDIFNTFFGEADRSHSRTYADRTRPQAGSDILISITLTFKESVLGVKKKVTLPLERACGVCQQTGAASRSDIGDCPVCQGRGVVNTIQRTILGTIRTQDTCARCQGEGKIIKKK
ncbi:63_t:CDS:2, partial [Racocetra persica]